MEAVNENPGHLPDNIDTEAEPSSKIASRPTQRSVEEKSPTEYTELVRAEYRELRADEPTIGMLIMVKNEHRRIHVTLESLLTDGGDDSGRNAYVDALIVYDTGSTDDTVEIIKAFSEKHRINLYMIQGEFVNFSVSRNVSLEYADTIPVKFLLLMDTNDELRGGEKLRAFTKSHMNTETTAYLFCQHWWSGAFDKYFNVRMVKARNGWRYRGSVHEWMKDTLSETDQPRVAVWKMPDDIVLYQDRTQDDDKSLVRFHRDKELLLKEHLANPKDPRTLFYLAQTCACLGECGDALYYYRLRSKLEGFQEEKFHALLRSGDMMRALRHEWKNPLAAYLRAAEHSNRAEPYTKIAKYYCDKRKWVLAHTFASAACRLSYPTDAILFVDKRAYDYERWHLLGICSYYLGFYEEGEKACRKAIAAGVAVELDTKNLKFYEEKMKGDEGCRKVEGELEPAVPVPAPVPRLTKNQFLEQEVKRLCSQNKRLKLSQARKQALKSWKERRSS